MPFYSRDYTVAPGSEMKEELWVEGSRVSYVNVSFPPGSHGLLKVAIFYGEKKIYPWEEGTFIKGDYERIETHAAFELPESPCRLLIYAKNEDTTYPHTFFLRLETEPLSAARTTRFRVTEEGYIEVEV
jgi:hypothetical protein